MSSDRAKAKESQPVLAAAFLTPAGAAKGKQREREPASLRCLPARSRTWQRQPSKATERPWVARAAAHPQPHRLLGEGSSCGRRGGSQEGFAPQARDPCPSHRPAAIPEHGGARSLPGSPSPESCMENPPGISQCLLRYAPLVAGTK